jgi:hypothetical protein
MESRVLRVSATYPSHVNPVDINSHGPIGFESRKAVLFFLLHHASQIREEERRSLGKLALSIMNSYTYPPNSVLEDELPSEVQSQNEGSCKGKGAGAGAGARDAEVPHPPCRRVFRK